jgi:hypothetical protein
MERADVAVQQVVAVPAAELGQCFRHLGDLGRHQVAPQASVRQPHLRLDRPVGVDRVAAVDEEVGAGAAHRLVSAEAAAALVDAPALAGGVARPQEAHVAARRRRGAEAAEDGGGNAAAGIRPLEGHAVEDVGVRRQPRQVRPRREVARLRGEGA